MPLLYLGLLKRIRRDREAKAREEELAKAKGAPQVAEEEPTTVSAKLDRVKAAK